MANFYVWLWTFWGAITAGIVLGLVLVAIGAIVKEATVLSNEIGLQAFGSALLWGTVIYGVLWRLLGPFSVHWILIPVAVIAIGMISSGLQSYQDEMLLGGTLLVATCGLAYLVAFNDRVWAFVAPAAIEARVAEKVAAPAVAEAAAAAPAFLKGEDNWWLIARDEGVNADGGSVPRTKVDDFWPAAEPRAAGEGLITEDGMPVFVLASGYLTPLFNSQATEFPAGVADIMRPFRPYRVVRRQGPVILVAEPPSTEPIGTFWVRADDVYVWATGMSADVTGATAVYGSEALARSNGQALTPTQRFVAVNLPASAASGPQPLSRLPVLRHGGDVAALLCPAYGGQVCWVNLSTAGNGVTVSGNP